MIEPGSYLDRVFVNFSLRREDELAALVTHIVGFGLNMIMAGLLIVFAAIKIGDVTSIVSFSVFSLFFTLYYIFSILFHALDKVKNKKIFRILELNSKYLVFFGAALPLTLGVVGGQLGWIFFGIFTALISVGILVTSLNKPKSSSITTIINLLIFAGLIAFLVMSWQTISFITVIWLGISLALLVGGIFIDNLGAYRFHHATSHLMYLFLNVSLFFSFIFGIILV